MSSTSDRVTQIIEYLFDQFRADTGFGQQNALVLLLHVLRDKVQPEDALYQALETLAFALEKITYPPVASVGAPLRHC